MAEKNTKSRKEDFLFFISPLNPFTTTAIVSALQNAGIIIGESTSDVEETRSGPTGLPTTAFGIPRNILAKLVKSQKIERQLDFEIWIPGPEKKGAKTFRRGEFLFKKKKKILSKALREKLEKIAAKKAL